MIKFELYMLPHEIDSFINTKNGLFFVDGSRLWKVDGEVVIAYDSKDLEGLFGQCAVHGDILYFATDSEDKRGVCTSLDLKNLDINPVDLPLSRSVKINNKIFGVQKKRIGRNTVFVYQDGMEEGSTKYPLVMDFSVSSDYLYFIGLDEKGVCLNHDLTERWVVKHPGDKIKDRVVYYDEEFVLITSNSVAEGCSSVCLSADSGKELWSVLYSERPFRVACYGDDLIASVGSRIDVYDRKSGKIVHQLETGLVGGRILCCKFEEYLVCIGEVDRRIEIYEIDIVGLFRKSIDFPAGYSPCCYSGNPVLSEGKLYVRLMAQEDALFTAWRGFYVLSLNDLDGELEIETDRDRIHYSRVEVAADKAFYDVTVDCDRLDDVIRMGEVVAREIACLYGVGGSLADNSATMDKAFTGEIRLSSGLPTDLKIALKEEVGFINQKLECSGFEAWQGGLVKLVIAD